MGTQLRASTQILVDADLDINSHKLIHVSNGTANNDAVNKGQLDNAITTALSNFNAMEYKGSIDCSTNPNYPAANSGWTFYISVAGKIGGASGVSVQVGDIIACKFDGSSAGDQATVGTNWDVIPSGASLGQGVANSTGSSTDNAIARFDLATGNLIQNSNVTIDDSGNVDIPSGSHYKQNGTNLSYADVGAQAALGFTPENVDNKGAASGYASLNASSLVVQNPASANATPGANVIPIADGTGKLNNSFIAGDFAGGVDKDDPLTGTKNGTNTIFTIPNTPRGLAIIYVNGIKQKLDVDYTKSGLQITFAIAPISTDDLSVTYVL